jgi:response regulator RpfG family c-di-GMP phosphodiesterase
MTAAPGLMDRLTALRQRLGELTLPTNRPPAGQQLRDLELQLASLRQANRQLEQQLTQLLGEGTRSEAADGPPALTWRLRRLLLRARQQIEQLKALTHLVARHAPEGAPQECLQATIALAEFLLRTIETLPADHEVQDRLGDGLEAGLAVLNERHQQLAAVAERMRQRHEQVESLARLLERLAGRQPVAQAEFDPLIEALRAQHTCAQPLVWYGGVEVRQSRWAARQGLNTAAVLARALPEQGEAPLVKETLLAALVHDVGLIPLEGLQGQVGEYSAEQRRELERHPSLGAELIAAAWPDELWLADAVAAHHENLDGTGYPQGRTSGAISQLARWLRIGATYAALCQANHRRRALNPRAALTEVLLEAERGKLDLALGEKLQQQVTPTPTGTLVELSDGSLGLVRLAKSRPLVQLVAGADGRAPALPEFLDLARLPQRQMVRVFPLDEARQLLGPDHLELW